MRLAGRKGPAVDVADAVRQEVARARRGQATSRELAARAADALTVRASVTEELTARRAQTRTQLRRLRRTQRSGPATDEVDVLHKHYWRRRDERVRAMQLSGVRSVGEIGADLIAVSRHQA